MGTISSGKSTLLNSLLGQQLLPSRNQSCTTQVAQIGHQNTDRYQNTYISINEQSFASLEEASKQLTRMRDSPNMDKINIKTQSYFHKTLSKDLQEKVFFIDTPGIDIYNTDTEYLNQFEKINQQIELDEYSIRINVWVSDYTTFDRDKKRQSNILSKIRNKAEQIQQQNQNQENNQIQQQNDESSQLFFIINKFDQRMESNDKPFEEINQDIKEVFNSDNIFKISALRALNYNIMNYGTKDAQDCFIQKQYQNTQSNMYFTDESQARDYCEKKIKNNHQLIKFQEFLEFILKISLSFQKILNELFNTLLNDFNQQISFFQFGEEIKNAKEKISQQQKDQIYSLLKTFKQNLKSYEQQLNQLKAIFFESIGQIISQAKESIDMQEPQTIFEKSGLQIFNELKELNQKVIQMTSQFRELLLHNLNLIFQNDNNGQQQPSIIVLRCKKIFESFMESSIAEYLEQFVTQSIQLNCNLGILVYRPLTESAFAVTKYMINNKLDTFQFCILHGAKIICYNKGIRAIFKVPIPPPSVFQLALRSLMSQFFAGLYHEKSTKLYYRPSLLKEKLNLCKASLDTQSQDLVFNYSKNYSKALTEIEELLK